MTPFILYWSPGASSLAPHVLLEEAGMPYESKRVLLQDGEQHRPEYLAINPRGRVPALAVDGWVLTENLAILVYLAERFPHLNLLPDEPWARAQSLSTLAWCANSIHGQAFAQVFRAERFCEDDLSREHVRRRGLALVDYSFEEIERRFATHGHMSGTRYALPDLYALVFYRWGAVNLQIDMEKKYPNYTRAMREMIQRPAVRRALDLEDIDLDR